MQSLGSGGEFHGHWKTLTMVIMVNSDGYSQQTFHGNWTLKRARGSTTLDGVSGTPSTTCWGAVVVHRCFLGHPEIPTLHWSAVFSAQFNLTDDVTLTLVEFLSNHQPGSDHDSFELFGEVDFLSLFGHSFDTSATIWVCSSPFRCGHFMAAVETASPSLWCPGWFEGSGLIMIHFKNGRMRRV